MPGLAAESEPPARTETRANTASEGPFSFLFCESLDQLTLENEDGQETCSANHDDGAIVVALPISVQERIPPLPLTLDFDLAREVDTIRQRDDPARTSLVGDEPEMSQADPAQIDVPSSDRSNRETAFSARLVPLESISEHSSSAEHGTRSLLSRSLAQFAPAYKMAPDPAAVENGDHNSADPDQGNNQSGASGKEAQTEFTVGSFALPEASSQTMPTMKLHSADTGRTAEVGRPSAELPLEPTPSTQSAREINIRIAEHGTGAQLRLIDRAGEVLVSVKSADAALAQSLRTDLHELAQKLESSGFRADISLPDSTSITSDQNSNDTNTYGRQKTDSEERQSPSGGGQGRQHKQQNNDSADWAEEWNQS
jgi:hypothetical protein